eukprot:EG_transcript_2018
MVEGRSGHLKVMDKPPVGLCSQCEASVRVAYDGSCQTLSRLRWERRWQKQIKLEIDAFKQLYYGKVALPEAIQRLQAEVESLQGVIDALLSDGPLPPEGLPSARLHSLQRELEAERAQNALLESALRELQLAMQEEDARLAEENGQLRTAMQLMQKTERTSGEVDGSATDGSGDGSCRPLELALQAERAANDSLRHRLLVLEAAAASSGGSGPAPHITAIHPDVSTSQEREYLEDKLLAMERQMGALVQERDMLQARLAVAEGAPPGHADAPFTALKLESELVTLRGELIVERQAHDTAKSQLELERERRALLEKRTEEDARELAAVREECLALTAKAAQAQQQLRQKVGSTPDRVLSPVGFEPIDGSQEFHRQRINDLQQALSAEKQRSDALQQELPELRYQATAAQRNEKVLADQLQVLMDELKAKETALAEAEEAVKANRRAQQEQDRELRRLRDELQMLRSRGGRTTPSALSKAGSGRTSPNRSAASPPTSPTHGRTSQTLAQSAFVLSNDHVFRRSSDGSGLSDVPLPSGFARATAAAPPTVPPVRPGTVSPISAVSAEELRMLPMAVAGGAPVVVPRLGLAGGDGRPTPLSGTAPLASDRTVDPGSPREDDAATAAAGGSVAVAGGGGDGGLRSPDQQPGDSPRHQLRTSLELQAAADRDPHVAQILWELRDAQRRHLLDRACALLTRGEADAILAAAQHLRERVTSLPKWPGIPLSDAPLNAPRRASIPHATRVVEGVTLYEAIRRAAEGVVDRAAAPAGAAGAGPDEGRCWQAIADATLALHRLLDA